MVLLVTLALHLSNGLAPAPAAPFIMGWMNIRAELVADVAPTRTYLIFFADQAELTQRASQVISEAAANSNRLRYTDIEVNGHTATFGTPRDNQDLSVRRARAVEAELVRDGVPPNVIRTRGFGDTDLLVPTGPGVREPQNDRVEIIIR
jgi:OOP family OmpA-OmpF porin